MLSLPEPIWLTLKSRQLQAFLYTAVWILVGFVTVKLSPSNWIVEATGLVCPVVLVKWTFIGHNREALAEFKVEITEFLCHILFN